jgi:tetratricopeptide (TPR) repeat protein
VLPRYASVLFTAGRTEEAWAAVEAAEKYARKAGSGSVYENLADCMAEAGHPERALRYYTAALELPPDKDDEPEDVAFDLLRLRAARYRLRELLGPAGEDDRSARVEALLEAVRNTREGHPPGDRTARAGMEAARRGLVASLAAMVEVTDPTDRLVLKLSEKRDAWRLVLSGSGPHAMLLRVTTRAPRRFRRLRVEPVETAAGDTERAILDTVLEVGRTLVRAEDAEAAVTWSGPLGEPVDGPLYQALFGTLPGTGGGIPWQ